MPPKGDLLFINKTSRSSSLSNSRSEASGARRINQHVQRTRDLERERKARRARKAAALFRAPPSLSERDSQGTPSVNTVDEDPQSLSTLPETPATVATISSNARRDPNDYDVEEITRSSTLDLMIPSGGTVEPFNVVKVTLDNEKYKILQYYVRQFFPAVTRSDTGGFLSSDVAANRLPARQMVQDSLSHPMHTYALLTGASARMKHVTHSELSRIDLTEQFAEIAIKMLREHMAEGRGVDEKLLQSMYYLWATESYRRNWDGVRTHRRMVKYLYTKYLGGFHNLNIHLRKMLWFADRFQASATAEPPIIEESWQAGDISEAEFTIISKAIKKNGKVQMGSAFSRYSTYFSEPFRDHLNEVMQLASVIQCHWTHVGVTMPDRDWVIGRSYTLSDRLLYFQDGRPHSPDSLPIILQDCIRLAIIVWLAFIPSPRTGVSPPLTTHSPEVKIRATVDARPLRTRFDTLLAFDSHHISPCQQNDIDKLFLWIAGVGSLASELEENQVWFVGHFGRLAEKLGVDSWSAFAPVDRSFLWLERLESVCNSRLTLLLLTRGFGEA